MVPKHNIITIDVSLDLKKFNKRDTIPDIRNLAILWDCKVIYLRQESMTITLQDKNIPYDILKLVLMSPDKYG